MGKFSNIELFKEKSVNVHGKLYDYANAVYIDNRTKLEINCPIHGSFFQIPSNHLSGNGCPKCTKNGGQFKPMSSEVFVERSIEKHGDKYDYSKTVFKNSKTKIEVNCHIHGSFLILPPMHLNGVGCKACYKNNLSKTTEQFIEEAKKIHGECYNYSESSYLGAKTKIKIICPEHGAFFQKANNHLSGNGCPTCGKIRRGKQFRLSKSDFILKANRIFGGVYDYELSDYTIISEKIKIKCKKHEVIFEQTAGNHLSGRYGCSKCRKWKSQNAWLDSLNIPDDDDHRQVKLHIGGKCFIADGYDPLTNTVYEYWGTYFHGHPDYYNSDDINTVCKKKFGELYQETLEKIQTINEGGYNLIQQWAHHYSGKFETLVNPPGKNYKSEIKSFLLDNNISYKIGKYDFVLTEHNIAIEVNDLKWCSSHFVDKNYLFEKMKACHNDGLRLISINEDEWLKNQLAIKLKILHECGKGERGIGARKHFVRQITITEGKNFTDKHHIQGSSGSVWKAYGSFINHSSFFDEKLVAVMLFNHQRGTNAIELVRFCTDGKAYAGLFSKIFNVFVEENPQINSVLSFADCRYSNGRLYETCGFEKIGKIPPDYKYVIDMNTYHKSNFTKANISKKFGLDMSKLTERQAMEQLGIPRIYDCGKIKYMWTRT